MARWRTRFRAKVKWTRACVICGVSFATVASPSPTELESADWIDNMPIVPLIAESVVLVMVPLIFLPKKEHNCCGFWSAVVAVASLIFPYFMNNFCDRTGQRLREIANQIELISIRFFLHHFRTVILIPITSSATSHIQIQYSYSLGSHTHSARAYLLRWMIDSSR